MAQNNNEDAIEVAWWQGFKVELDAFSAVMSFVNEDTYSFEGNIQLNLKEKYFPVVELGYGGADRQAVGNNAGFQSSGLFTRIGIDYNLLKPNDPENSIRKYFFISGRYAFSNFTYDINNIIISDDYWDGSITKDPVNINTTKHWLEIGGGLRVEIFKNVFMGWSVKRRIRLGKERDYEPWYIPGIGITSTGNWGFNYTIGYSF